MTPEDLESRKASLEDWIDLLGSWMIGFVWPVAVGLLIEFYAVLGLSWTQSQNALIARIGLLLVTAGVIGELVIGHKTHGAERKLRALNVEIEHVADLNLKAADERIALLNLSVERERLARIKIEEELFKQHVLTDQARDEIIEAVGTYIGRKRVDVFLYDHHIHEVFQLADSVNAAFLSAGWKSKLWIGAEPRMMGSEVNFSVSRDSPIGTPGNVALQQLAGRLSGILFSLGIGSCMSQGGFSSSNLPIKPLGGWGIWDPHDVAEFRVQIGHRQLNSNLFSRPVAPPQA